MGALNIDGLRNFIDELEKLGELRRIAKETDWKHELGAIAGEAGRLHRLALLFDNIKDYKGFRFFTNGLGSHSKIAIALGLELVTPFEGIVDAFKQRIRDPVDPVLVEESPVDENVFTGNDVDLERLPVPWFHAEDGGRYIGTWHLNVTKDPESGARNAGVYRMQLLGPRRTAISISPKSHLARHLAKARTQGGTIEMGTAIGVEETLVMAAAAAPPYGLDEFRLAGGLSRRPVALTRCLTVDLELPACAEIVLEGKIDPGLRIAEGPFLDYAGVPKRDPAAFVFEVSCLKYRNNPVFRGAATGSPGGEDHLLFSLLSSADLLDFHGSGLRQKIQNHLLKRGSYELFQYSGRLRHLCAKASH